jgi:hypothetical protein
MKNLIIVILLLTSTIVDGQWIASKFRVSFKDKNNSPYSLSNPSQYLSQRAIERRTKYNIPLKMNDIPVNQRYVDSIKSTGVTILNKSKWFNSVTIQTTDYTKLTTILAFSFVTHIDTVGESPSGRGAKKAVKKRDTMEGYLIETDLNNNITSETSSKYYDYGQSYTQVHQLATDYLHDIGFRGEGMVIAVLDAGFYNVDKIDIFDSLWANNQVLGSKDFVNPGGSVFSQSTHGMMVLSIMGGNKPEKLIGTAPKAKYWLLRSEDADSEYLIEEDNWASAAEYADSVGADVINSSLGYTTFDNPYMNHKYSELNGRTYRSSIAAATAAGKGILVVNSAGNSGNQPWKYISAPADADSIITAGAVDGSGVYASFSSVGPTADHRVKPTITAMGQGTYVTTTSGDVSPGNGTSFSSPVLAGSVACLWQANRDKSNLEIIEALIKSANYYTKPNDTYGYGIPNLMAANYLLKNATVAFSEEQRLVALPNPFLDRLYISYFSKEEFTTKIELYDMTGKLSYSKENILIKAGINYISLYDLSSISKGTYILKLENKNGLESIKVVK